MEARAPSKKFAGCGRAMHVEALDWEACHFGVTAGWLAALTTAKRARRAGGAMRGRGLAVGSLGEVAVATPRPISELGDADPALTGPKPPATTVR